MDLGPASVSGDRSRLADSREPPGGWILVDRPTDAEASRVCQSFELEESARADTAGAGLAGRDAARIPRVPRIGRAPTILYYKRTEGYFWQAAFDVQDSRSFLAGYRDSISKGDDPDRYLHLGHTLRADFGISRTAAVDGAVPRLAQAVVATEPPAIRETFETLRSFPPPNGASWSPAAEATLWAATLLTLLAARRRQPGRSID